MSEQIPDYIKNGFLQDFKFFIEEEGYDVNTKDENGCTLLHWASISGNIDSVRYLLEKGADIDIKNKAGCTALEYALNVKAYRIFIRLLFEKVIKFFKKIFN